MLKYRIQKKWQFGVIFKIPGNSCREFSDGGFLEIPGNYQPAIPGGLDLNAPWALPRTSQASLGQRRTSTTRTPSRTSARRTENTARWWCMSSCRWQSESTESYQCYGVRRLVYRTLRSCHQRYTHITAGLRIVSTVRPLRNQLGKR